MMAISIFKSVLLSNSVLAKLRPCEIDVRVPYVYGSSDQMSSNVSAATRLILGKHVTAA